MPSHSHHGFHEAKEIFRDVSGGRTSNANPNGRFITLLLLDHLRTLNVVAIVAPQVWKSLALKEALRDTPTYMFAYSNLAVPCLRN